MKRAISNSKFAIRNFPIVASDMKKRGPEKVKTLYFGEDHPHTTVAGAELNAASVIAGLKTLKDCRLGAYLLSGSGPGKSAVRD